MRHDGEILEVARGRKLADAGALPQKAVARHLLRPEMNMISPILLYLNIFR